MEEVVRLIFAVLVLALGLPIGTVLAKATKEELKQGRKWFKIIMIFCAVGAIASLIFRNDVTLFTFLFIAIVTSRSL